MTTFEDPFKVDETETQRSLPKRPGTTKFKYAATDLDGDEVKGQMYATSPNAARNELAVRGLRVDKLSERRGLKMELTKEKVPRVDLMHFCRQMSIYLRAGVPLTEALDELRLDTTSKRLQTVLADSLDRVSAGESFAETFAANEDIAPGYFVAILRSSELTGRMDDAFEQLHDYLERDVELRRQVRKALIYPSILLVLALSVCLLLIVFAIPKFAEFFDGFGAELPLPTRILIGISDLVQSPVGAAVGVVGAIGVVGLIAFVRTSPGRHWLQRTQLRTPVVRNVVKYSASERFARVLAALIDAGVPLPSALPTAVESTENIVFSEKLTVAMDGILAGQGFADPLATTEMFPRSVVQMIRVGERTGDLSSQLQTAAELFKSELNYSVEKLTAWFEPLITIFIGVVVGFVALAMVTAMYGIYNQVDL